MKKFAFLTAALLAVTYVVVSAIAQISNSPFTQNLTLVGSSGSATITSVGSTNYTFAAQAGNANSTIGTLSAAVSSGSFGGTLTLATSGGCTGANNGLFAISGSALKIGASDITTPSTYSICVKATDATFTNSPFYQALTLTGTGAGLVVTTATFQNDTGSALPAGTPVSFGQGFRYGDIMPGTYPLIRDASTHVALPGQQWDEISTFHENGGNSSWRHAVWAAWLPTSVASGATYQVEFLTTAGTYSQSSHQPLSTLCSGAAAHDLKIHLTDVRNQNDTLRDSGDATFRLCDNIANTGRDAPRHVRAGNVYDEYVVSGMPLYTSARKDPLLYAQCIVDIFTKASDGTSAGDVRHVCHLINAWENVASGSSGNAGNPGPAGFANDPQFVSFRTEIDDGASDVLDWSGLDATVSSASNPVVNASANACNHWGETVCLNIPSSTGANAWYLGQATRVSSTGTPVGGLVNGQLYWILPSGTATSNANTGSQYVSPQLTPYIDGGVPFPMTSSQGTGSTTFSTRQTLYHFEAFQTLDATGLLNWAPFGTTTRVTRKIYPAFTTAEQKYWEQSGVIIPLNLTQPIASSLGPRWNLGGGINYEPMGALNVTGGTGGGDRVDLGISNDYSAKAFITETQTDWDLARLFTYGTPVHGFMVILDESSGRISPLNNGPPTGPGGNGNGGTYAGLGPNRNQIQTLLPQSVPVNGLAQPLDYVPTYCMAVISQNCHYAGGGNPANGGAVGFGTTIDHMPSFDGFSYIVFGERQFLDMMQWLGNGAFAQQRVGPGPELGQGYYRDNNAQFTDGNTYHYYGLTTICCQARGSAWLTRDVLYPATFGADSSPERQYFGDLITETGNYWPLFLAYRDGPGNANYSLSIYGPDEPDTVGGGTIYSGFVSPGYVGSVAYVGEAWLHTPMFSIWNSRLQRFYEGVCGNQLPGATVPDWYCADESLMAQIHDGAAVPTGFGGNIGRYMNGTDASDWGSFDAYINILSGGQVAFNGYPTVTAGDTLHMIYSGWDNGQLGAGGLVDQLSGTRWYTMIAPIVNGGSSWNHTFYVQCTAADHVAWPTQCPTAGGAFTGFTRNGAAITNDTGIAVYRFQYDPGQGVGYLNPNYAKYLGMVANSLTVLGHSTTHVMANFASRCNLPSDTGGCYNTSYPSWWWDPTIVVPGLPPAVNAAEWALTSGSVSGTTVADYAAGNNPATVANGPLTFGALGANFNGSSQYLDNATMTVKTPALTVATWFRPDTLSGNQRLVANSHTDADQKGFQLVINNGGAGGFFDVGNGTAEGRVSWTQQLVGGTWYHYVGVYDGATVKAYINGAQVASTAFAGGAIAAGTGPDINVGRNPTYAGDYFTGGIYDPQIMGQALSANQVLALYNRTTPPAPAGIACDIGPPYQGSVPAPAAAAGFTHCVANYDFTVVGGAFSNVNNFIDICGASSPLLYDRTYTAFHQPCSDYSIVNDSANGAPQALQVTYTQADKAAGNNTITFLGTTSGQGDPTPPGVWLKGGWYAEEVMRLTPTTVNSSCSGNPPGAGGCLEADFWAYPVQGSCPGCPNNLEFDFVEVYTGNDGTGTYASAGLASGGGSGVFPGIGNTAGGNTSFLTTYNTYGSLNTVVNSGSGNNYSGCWYLNPQTGAHSWSCVNTNISTQSFGTNMEFYLAEEGIQPGTALPYLLTDSTVLIQRATIFACGPAGASTPCYTSSVVNY